MGIKTKVKKTLNTLRTEKKVPVPVQVNTTRLLEGKTALITGGSGGIGQAVAKSFLKNGAQVIVSGTNEEKLKGIVAAFGQTYPGMVKYIVMNVSAVDKIPGCIETASKLFGQIDILVNSAGVINKSRFLELDEKEYDKIMDINVKGTFFVSQAVGRYMIDHQIKGHILNVSSASALRPAWTPYQMSKWAIRGFTLGLADTLLPYGIIVNAIAPGPVATKMLGKSEDDSIESATNPSGRYLTPDEIANLATFMVSDMGDMIVGDTFYITGGSGTLSMHK